MLGANVIIFELARFGLSRIQDFFQPGAEEQIGGTRALDFVAAGQLALDIRFQFGRGHPDFLQQVRDKAVGLADERQQQMFPIYFLVRKPLSDTLRLLQRFL